jgi:hypothetical protein
VPRVDSQNCQWPGTRFLRRCCSSLWLRARCTRRRGSCFRLQWLPIRGTMWPHRVAVAPDPGDDVAAPCGYELTLLDPARTIRGVWVIFDRGRDMLRYYGDPDVQAFAGRHDLALLLAFHCRAKSTNGDINVEPAKGLGRALFAALGQLGQMSKHPELGSVGVILMGFSGTGTLVARFPEFALNACARSSPPVRATAIRLASTASDSRRRRRRYPR